MRRTTRQFAHCYLILAHFQHYKLNTVYVYIALPFQRWERFTVCGLHGCAIACAVRNKNKHLLCVEFSLREHCRPTQASCLFSVNQETNWWKTNFAQHTIFEKAVRNRTNNLMTAPTFLVATVHNVSVPVRKSSIHRLGVECNVGGKARGLARYTASPPQF